MNLPIKDRVASRNQSRPKTKRHRTMLKLKFQSWPELSVHVLSYCSIGIFAKKW